MDFENFDEAIWSPERIALKRLLKAFAVLLLLTFVLPIDRNAAGPINIWDRFGVADTLDTIRHVLPAIVGLLFGYLGFVSKLSLKIEAAIASAALILLVLVGVNPFEVLRVVIPPISGDARSLDMIALTTGVTLPMVDGEYFPREDTLHLILLGLGLAALGVGGRYRSELLSSRIGTFVMMGATALIVAYYAVPYGGKMAAQRNVELYTGFYEVAGELKKQGDEMERAIDEIGEQAMLLAEEKMALRARAREQKMAGQLKLSAGYFLAIYFVPLALCLFGAFAWGRSRYRGHRAVFGRLAGWGASAYLLAFLLPLLFKEGMRQQGPGFLPNLRSYIVFAAVFVGITVAGAALLRELIEPNANDDALHDDPLAWKNAA